jgi:Icc-related predicted phosphoesterase
MTSPPGPGMSCGRPCGSSASAVLGPFLGSYFLAEAIDGAGADLAVHGHAHAGQECGVTPGGTEVRNVALPVLRRAYALYVLGEGASGTGATVRYPAALDG